MYDTIQYEVTEAEMIAEVTLDRPDHTNALSGELIDELVDAVETAEDDDDVRVIILTGQGDNFSAGYDMSGSGHQGGVPPALIYPFVMNLHEAKECPESWSMPRVRKNPG